MTKIYDYVFVTHLPAFYKNNLYNKLAQRLSIFVIFISNGSCIRTLDFASITNYRFDYVILNQVPFEQRSIIRSSLKIIHVIDRLEFKKIILGGWDLFEFWLAWGRVPKAKLAIAVESSIHESKTTGPKSWLKKIFMSNIHTAYVSGLFQKNLVEKLNFTQTQIITGGVGLITPPKKPALFANQIKPLKHFTGRFLYLGRLSQEKNIDLLIHVFSYYLKNYSLTLAGTGPLEKDIQDKIKHQLIQNINVVGHVPNADISQLFYDHDILLLPSQQEPWGLVVEEAIAHGLPVIVSDKVGCHPEMIHNKINGYVFKTIQNNIKYNSEQLITACRWVEKNHATLLDNIENNPVFSWKTRERKQIEAYSNIINK